jgi:hypothetical protein
MTPNVSDAPESASPNIVLEEFDVAPRIHFYQLRAERRVRLLIAATVAPSLLAAISYLVLTYTDVPRLFSDPSRIGYSQVPYQFGYFLIGILLLTSITGAVSLYLETGFRFGGQWRRSPAGVVRIESNEEAPPARPQAAERDETVPAISILSSYETRSRQIAAQSAWDEPTNARLEDISARTDRMLSRLAGAVDKQDLRNNINLATGFAITLAGVSALSYFVLTQPAFDPNEPWSVLAFLPKLSLVLLIEVFAYFFLNLYKNGLSELKYFQNEMTHIEAKLLALSTAIHGKDQAAAGQVIAHLAQFDRNATLVQAAQPRDATELLKTLQDAVKLADKVAAVGKGQ